ncbi:uncharacterized protein [Miscanthus floridulus]|uniref:uncharacterized protein n=1 Tax=Miscanthus floridulus TaxID=154761 RepID=UPI00345AA5E6
MGQHGGGLGRGWAEWSSRRCGFGHRWWLGEGGCNAGAWGGGGGYGHPAFKVPEPWEARQAEGAMGGADTAGGGGVYVGCGARTMQRLTTRLGEGGGVRAAYMGRSGVARTVGDEADGGVPLVGDGRKRGRAVSETEGNGTARLGQSEAGLLRSIRGRWADLGFGPSGGGEGKADGQLGQREARPVRAAAEKKEAGPEREKKRKWANGLLG